VVSGEWDEVGHGRADSGPAQGEIGCQRVDDVRAAPLAGNHTGVAQDLEVVADRRLADAAALAEVAGADAVSLGQLAHEREPDGVGERGEESDVGIDRLHLRGSISIAIHIDNDQYSGASHKWKGGEANVLRRELRMH
jgi:hypothetical protein